MPVGQPQGNGKTDVLLLRTGFLMEGVAVNEGTHYALKKEFSSMQIPVANFEFIGRNRQEVYFFRRNLIDGNNCQELMKFAEWCASNGLVKEAAEEYIRARRVVPNATLDSFIQRRIELLQQPPEDHPVLGTGLSQVVSADSGGDDLDHWVKGVPKPIVDSFQKKVQPILTSRCATSDCHGSASDNGFRVGIPRHASGSTTYRNLQAALRWIDPANPSASPLLAAMVSHHGGTKPTFNVESSQYINTIQWIQTAIKDLPTEYADQLYTAKQPKKSAATTVPVQKPPEGPQTFVAEAKQAPPSVMPVADPLDPALFNARFHGTVRR